MKKNSEAFHFLFYPHNEWARMGEEVAVADNQSEPGS
jgi:hypothetical protein